ncbi:MAG: hypothetical protein FWG50_13990 [Kiritimatiellaeota bacterium]|nr:hypothetical protein [Kiritimatiellota bacterium]
MKRFICVAALCVAAGGYAQKDAPEALVSRGSLVAQINANAQLCKAAARFAADSILKRTIVSEAQKLPAELASVDEQIKAAPNDPMLYGAKCCILFNMGKQQEAVDCGKVMLEKCVQAKNNQPWWMLGTITTDKYRVDVHYNMGASERADRASANTLMTFPYSFRVWSLEEPLKLVRIVDFEIMYMRGKPMTAAVGETTPFGHSNFGMLPTDADFATVKAKVLSVLGAKEGTGVPLRAMAELTRVAYGEKETAAP